MKYKFEFLITTLVLIISFGCSNELEDISIDEDYTCTVDTVSFLSESTSKSGRVEVVFSVSLAGDTKFYNVTENYTVNNRLMTIGDNLIHINEFTAKGETATFDFYYGENLGPFCMELFSAIPMHSHNAFNAEADRVISDKNLGKWKIKKKRQLPSNEIPE